MGAWDVDAFGNDTACDWAYGLEETDDLLLVENTIEWVLSAGDDYLEAPDAEEALAAAEVIARLQGNWGLRNAYSEPVDKWVEQHSLKPPAGLARKARAAIDRILAPPSELLELWEESEVFADWKAAVLDLKSRVKTEPASLV